MNVSDNQMSSESLQPKDNLMLTSPVYKKKGKCPFLVKKAKNEHKGTLFSLNFKIRRKQSALTFFIFRLFVQERTFLFFIS